MIVGVPRISLDLGGFTVYNISLLDATFGISLNSKGFLDKIAANPRGRIEARVQQAGDESW
jgi:hypothetical protein